MTFNTKKISILASVAKVFIAAFVLNFVWEYSHSFLYDNYKGGEITGFILFRAAIFDAVFITVLYLLFLRMPFIKKRLWVIFMIGFLSAIAIEIYALKTSRWAYGDMMPLVPILNIGLTPVAQLPVLYYLAIKFSNIKRKKEVFHGNLTEN
ncbi:MAG: hypothetical protein HYT36_00425 [Candidatus Staskawiczbacteria bacterium]|nr:hypothetical protein [Candidatus Staskawiczbacteria bacterium]